MLSAGGDELAPVHYSNFLTAVDRLLSHASETDLHSSSTHILGAVETPTLSQSTLHLLSTLVVDLYSGCAPKLKLLSLVEEILSVEHCSPNVCIKPHPGVELTTPTSTISQSRFVQHVEQTAKTNQENWSQR